MNLPVAIISSIIAYIATSIDYIFILLILFAEMKKDSLKDIILGQYVGFTILIVISLLGAFGLTFIPQQWIGLLGLIPMYLGFKTLFKDKEDDKGDEIVESAGKFSKLFFSVTSISLAAGGDNLGVYIPYFTTLNISELVVTLIIFYILVAVSCYISYKLASFKYISEAIEKFERIIVPIVFIALGIMIMYENGTFNILFN